ncbi:MAG: hypothetical protein OHK0029_04730 [Armatimonadaceae bacterium]
MKRSTVATRVAIPVFVVAAIVCGISGYRWLSDARIRGHFARAEKFVEQRKGPEAEAEWKAVLKEDPRNTVAQELLAEYYLSHQDWQLAADAFQTLGKMDPKQPHVLCRQAAAMLRMDDQKGAFELAEKEIQRDPKCVAALGLVASLMAQRPGTDQKKQLNYLRQLAELLPDDLDVQRMYAEALTNQYRYDELRPVLDNMLRLSPTDAQAHNLYGFADLARADQPQGAQEAVARFQKSLEVAPDNPGAHFGLGRAYLQLGKATEAVQELERAARDLPGMARVHKELVSAYRAAGQKDKAATAQKRFLELQSLMSEERVLIVRCVAYPQNADYPRRLGQLYLKIGDPIRAVYYFRQAAERKPGDATIQTLLVQAEEASLAESARLTVPQ